MMFTYKKCVLNFYDNWGFPVDESSVACYAQLEKKEGDSFKTLYTWDIHEKTKFPLNVFDAYALYLTAMADKKINL